MQLDLNDITLHDSGLVEDAEVFTLSETAVVIDAATDLANLSTQEKIWQLADAVRFFCIQNHQDALQQFGLLDIVPGMYNLTLIFDPLLTQRQLDKQTVNNLPKSTPVEFWTDCLKQGWRDISGNQTPPQNQLTGKVIDIPIHYGGEYGPDLDAVAEHSGLSADQVINTHSSREYTVCFIGFQPGFAYLHGLNPLLNTPRKATPRQCVAAGSVAIGGSQTGIYPLASPGGWQIIGRYLTSDTLPSLFNIQQNPASLLQAGDRLRFVRND